MSDRSPGDGYMALGSSFVASVHHHHRQQAFAELLAYPAAAEPLGGATACPGHVDTGRQIHRAGRLIPAGG
jgi:hypothetical protein